MTPKQKQWDSLGISINESFTKEEILSKSKADYIVVLNPVQVYDKNLEAFVSVPDRYVTGRINPETDFLDNWEVVKGRYEILPNSLIVDKALAIVEKSSSATSLHNCGVLDDGRKFYVSIKTSGHSLQVGEVFEYIDSYVVVMTSHDGSMPVCYYNLDVRRKNKSVYRIDSKEHDFVLKKRHTPNAKDRLEEAQEVLHMREEWSSEVVSALQDLQVKITDDKVNLTLNKFWSLNKANTKKKRQHAESVHEKINELFRTDYNKGVFGQTKWALLNALNEYIDFHRNIPDAEAAQHCLEIDNFSHRLKVQLFNFLKEI